MSFEKKYRFLDELDGSYFVGYVRIRVLQKNVTSEASVDMVVIDQKGTTINVKIMNTHAEKFVHTLKERMIYDISRFSTPKAKWSNRPTKHERVMFLNTNSTVDPIPDIAGFPTRRALDYIKLDEAMDIALRQDNTYLHDIIGVVVYVSTVNAYSSDKLKRVIGIQDTTGTTIKIVLWNEYAADFDQLEIGEKSVLALASVAVNKFKGFDTESFVTSKFTQLLVDSNNPRAVELKKRDDYTQLEEGVALADWREKNRKSLTAIINEFNPDSDEGTYTCVAEVIGHNAIMHYCACKNCNTKSPEECASFFCKRCKVETATHTYCRMEVTISDKNSKEVVILFGNQLENIFKMKLPKILSLSSDLQQSSKLYHQLLHKTFVFELKPEVYYGGLSFSVYRVGEDINSDDVLANRKSKRKISLVSDEVQVLNPSTPSKTSQVKRTRTPSTRAKKTSTTMLSENSPPAIIETNLDGGSEATFSDGVSNTTPNL